MTWISFVRGVFEPLKSLQKTLWLLAETLFLFFRADFFTCP